MEGLGDSDRDALPGGAAADLPKRDHREPARKTLSAAPAPSPWQHCWLASEHHERRKEVQVLVGSAEAMGDQPLSTSEKLIPMTPPQGMTGTTGIMTWGGGKCPIHYPRDIRDTIVGVIFTPPVKIDPRRPQT